jgi:hypothetical protein
METNQKAGRTSGCAKNRECYGEGEKGLSSACGNQGRLSERCDI